MDLDSRQKDGRTLRWHLNVVYEKTGIMPPQLEVPPAPIELAHVWRYFLQMNAKRTVGMAANPLTDEAILAWQRRHHILLDPFEGECIDALDEVYLLAGQRQSEPQKQE
jgi:hypothetical protein